VVEQVRFLLISIAKWSFRMKTGWISVQISLYVDQHLESTDLARKNAELQLGKSSSPRGRQAPVRHPPSWSAQPLNGRP